MEQDLEALQTAWSALEPVDPPDLLDRAVMNAARRHLPGPAVPRPRWSAWLATAAVAVLAIGLVIRQSDELTTPEIAEERELQQEEPAVLERLRDAPEPRAEHESEEMLSAAGKRAEPAMARAESDGARQQALAPQETAADAAAAEGATVQRAADEWIEQLLTLKRHGRMEQLDRELRAFRQAYPDYRLPPELED